MFRKIVPSFGNGILLPKLFSPTVRKNCSCDREKLLKLEAEGREFAKFLRSLEQFKEVYPNTALVAQLNSPHNKIHVLKCDL